MTKKKITKAYARKNNLVRDYEIDEKKLRKIDIHKMPKRLEKLFARAFAFSPDYSFLDTERVSAYHTGTGHTVKEWWAIMTDYCEKRNRKHFFAYNEWRNPIIIFDCENVKEYRALFTKEREKEKKKGNYFLSPRKETNGKTKKKSNT
tara:strand:+ start:1232 stop:1675 length:444 start_codon:yes stop_codon:yes gene_type:complete